MKKLIPLLFLFLLFSCRNDKDYDQPNPVSTKISGKIADPTTGLMISNLKLILKRQWKQNCGGFSSCWKEENVAEITSDGNGNYSVSFDYQPANGREQYEYSLMPSDSNFRFDDYELQNIQPGIANTIDFVIWKPVKLYVNMKVSNNTVPPLSVEIKEVNRNNNFSNWSFFEKDGEQTFDFLVRPNTETIITFNYIENRNTPSAKEHKIEFPYTTLTSETTVSYTIDCSKF